MLQLGSRAAASHLLARARARARTRTLARTRALALARTLTRRGWRRVPPRGPRRARGSLVRSPSTREERSPRGRRLLRGPRGCGGLWRPSWGRLCRRRGPLYRRPPRPRRTRETLWSETHAPRRGKGLAVWWPMVLRSASAYLRRHLGWGCSSGSPGASPRVPRAPGGCMCRADVRGTC